MCRKYWLYVDFYICIERAHAIFNFKLYIIMSRVYFMFNISFGIDNIGDNIFVLNKSIYIENSIYYKEVFALHRRNFLFAFKLFTHCHIQIIKKCLIV